jgi:hypothetical protein
MLSTNQFLFLIIIIHAFENICSLEKLVAFMHRISKANSERQVQLVSFPLINRFKL